MDGRITASEDGSPARPASLPAAKAGRKASPSVGRDLFPTVSVFRIWLLSLAVVSNLTAPTSFRKTRAASCASAWVP